MADMIQTLSGGIMCVLASMKLSLFALRRKQIRHLFNRIEDKRITALRNEEYSDYIHETEIFGRKVTKIIFYAFIGLPVPLFILNTLSFYLSNFKRKQLLVKVFIGWSREKPLAHILANGLITIVTMSVIFVTVGFYIMEMTFAFYISAFIKILRNKLINKGINNKVVYDDHKAIIQLINDYNGILSGLIYIETVLSPLVPCGYALSVIRALQRRETGQVLDNSAKTLRCLMPALVSCTCGQLVLDEMEKLHEAAFMNNWYEEGTKARKNLLTLMTKTTNPNNAVDQPTIAKDWQVVENRRTSKRKTKITTERDDDDDDVLKRNKKTKFKDVAGSASDQSNAIDQPTIAKDWQVVENRSASKRKNKNYNRTSGDDVVLIKK
ncbi:hypothetical protein O3M35_002589 [Rhynocoris fuscipes]|uniref:Odorant receptor n=1 Tax=Rhynocoris fuscipes TaxID=488301 RepID=A0AAW1CPB8_9HEMI